MLPTRWRYEFDSCEINTPSFYLLFCITMTKYIQQKFYLIEIGLSTELMFGGCLNIVFRASASDTVIK